MYTYNCVEEISVTSTFTDAGSELKDDTPSVSLASNLDSGVNLNAFGWSILGSYNRNIIYYKLIIAYLSFNFAWLKYINFF